MAVNTKKDPTMKDIARIAGVSQATVSYVINDTEDISDAVRKNGYWMQQMNWDIYQMRQQEA